MASGTQLTALSLRSYAATGTSCVVLEEVRATNAYLTSFSWEGSASSGLMLGLTCQANALRWTTANATSTGGIATSTWGWDYEVGRPLP